MSHTTTKWPARTIRDFPIISYGGGVQTVALAILNVTGRIENPAHLAIFSDAGSEEPQTYEHIELMRPWLAARGMELITIDGRKRGLPLYEYVMTQATTIPARFATGGMGRRICTVDWKMEPINAELRQRAVKTAIIQLGISWDESHRMTDSRMGWVNYRYPLVDLRLTRADCRQIIMDARLPVPPKSACTFCPFQSLSAWSRRATEQRPIFEQAVALEEAICVRQAATGKPPAYLSRARRPLIEAFGQQQSLFSDNGSEDETCDGYCFT